MYWRLHLTAYVHLGMSKATRPKLANFVDNTVQDAQTVKRYVDLMEIMLSNVGPVISDT